MDCTTESPPTARIGSQPETADRAEIIKALRYFMPAASVVELRALHARTGGYGRPHTVSGYFDDPEKLASAAMLITQASGIYITINDIDPALLARAYNRAKDLDAKDPTTSDKDITHRRLFYFDFDPKRPSNISSTDEQLNSALDKAAEAREWLSEQFGFTEPVYAASGNGAHLVYRIDVPAEDNDLINRCLAAVKARWEDAQIGIDTTVSNPARICKLYGTVSKKGDHTPDRRHRQAHIIHAPDEWEVTPIARLEQLADSLPQADPVKASPPPKQSTDGNWNLHAGKGVTGDTTTSADWFDRFIQRHNIQLGQGEAYHGKTGSGTKWVLDVCPWNEDHRDRAFTIIHFDNGGASASCRHNGCAGKKWADFKALYETPGSTKGWQADRRQRDADAEPTDSPIEIIPMEDLISQEPELDPPVIDGLLRLGECGNLIAAPKTGKTWAAMWLAVATATGRQWFGYQCTPGRVLLIDNELKRKTLAGRLERVSRELKAPYGVPIDTVSLRGNLRGIDRLHSFFESIPTGKYSLVILDSLYRLLPDGCDENSNSDITKVYNTLDKYAGRLNAAFLCIHHTSKGVQGGKSATDVGAGAGAQARAVDAHIIMRPHAEDGIIVVDAVARSFPPPTATCWRVSTPHFTQVLTEDATNLKTDRQKKEKKEKQPDLEKPRVIPEVWTTTKFAAAFITTEGRIIERVMADALACGMKRREIESLLKLSVEEKLVHKWTGKPGSPTRFSTQPQALAQLDN